MQYSVTYMLMCVIRHSSADTIFIVTALFTEVSVPYLEKHSA